MSGRLLLVALAGVGALATSAVGGSASFAGEQPVAVSAGTDRTCAGTAAGAVQCWGVVDVFEDSSGPSNIISVIPKGVSGLTSGIQAIDAGGTEECALAAGGGAKCWGWDDRGQLGDGQGGIGCADEPCFYSDPVQVSGLSNGVQQIATGGSHVCALTTAGGVDCWGANDKGQVGDGTTEDRLEPDGVSGLSSSVSAITAGGSHSCALTTAGGVECWGDNASGQLGDGTTTNSSTPVGVSGLSSGVAAVAAGGSHTCALTTGGGVKCWGSNTFGQLGDGTTTERDTPVDVSGLQSGVSAIATGGDHTCALTTGGGVKCWGTNTVGQIGDGTTTERDTPVNVSGLQSSVSAITAGNTHSCALTTGSSLECWGSNDSGQLGDGTTIDRALPTSVLWGPVCLVPHVARRTVANVAAALVAHGCDLGQIYRAHSNSVKKGRVIAAHPDEGSYLAESAKIDLLVSKGKAHHGKMPSGKALRLRGLEGALAADGRTAAFPVAGKKCESIWIWRVGKAPAKVQASCESQGVSGLYDFALGGSRILWPIYDVANLVYCHLLTATAARPRPRQISFCLDEGDDPDLESFYGHGSLFAFNADSDVYDFQQGRPHLITRNATATSVDSGRISVLEPDHSVGVYTASGQLVNRIPAEVDRAKLSGNRLFAEAAGTVTPYDVGTGQPGQAQALQGGPFAQLSDVAAGIVVYVLGDEVHLLRLADGKDTIIRASAAQIEPSGLFYSSKRRVTFVPMGRVRRLFR